MRKPLSLESRQKLRDAALKNRPWEHATGPKTTTGKARSAANGLRKQDVPGPSIRELRRSTSDARDVITAMVALRGTINPSPGQSDKG